MKKLIKFAAVLAIIGWIFDSNDRKHRECSSHGHGRRHDRHDHCDHHEHHEGHGRHHRH